MATPPPPVSVSHKWAGPTGHPRSAMLEDMGFVHGLVMVIAFGLMFPTGATFLRLFGYKHIAWVHGLIQVTAFSSAIAGVTLGLYIGKHNGYGPWRSRNGHKIIGFAAFAIMIILPFLGAIHHHLHKTRGKGATWQGYTHRLLGRAALILGAVNIGLGLQLGRARLAIVAGYSTITALAFAAYFGVTIWKGPEGRLCWGRRRATRGGGGGSGSEREDVSVEGGQKSDSSGTIETKDTTETGGQLFAVRAHEV